MTLLLQELSALNAMLWAAHIGESGCPECAHPCGTPATRPDETHVQYLLVHAFQVKHLFCETAAWVFRLRAAGTVNYVNPAHSTAMRGLCTAG
jgi:hypothetical protein